MQTAQGCRGEARYGGNASPHHSRSNCRQRVEFFATQVFTPNKGRAEIAVQGREGRGNARIVHLEEEGLETDISHVSQSVSRVIRRQTDVGSTRSE